MLWSTIFIYLVPVFVVLSAVAWVVHLRAVRSADRVNLRVRGL